MYDGNQIIEEAGPNGNLWGEWVYGLGIDEPIMIKRGGQESYYHMNHLGSVSHITDKQGAVVERYSYDVYGAATILNADFEPQTGSAVGNIYYFTGRQLDFETGIYYYRARYYDAVVGRFLQRDPVEDDVLLNLYRYCINSPNNNVDPMGLTTWKLEDFEGAKEAIIDSLREVYAILKHDRWRTEVGRVLMAMNDGDILVDDSFYSRNGNIIPALTKTSKMSRTIHISAKWLRSKINDYRHFQKKLSVIGPKLGHATNLRRLLKKVAKKYNSSQIRKSIVLLNKNIQQLEIDYGVSLNGKLMTNFYIAEILIHEIVHYTQPSPRPKKVQEEQAYSLQIKFFQALKNRFANLLKASPKKVFHETLYQFIVERLEKDIKKNVKMKTDVLNE